jgi:hypothetical protein
MDIITAVIAIGLIGLSAYVIFAIGIVLLAILGTTLEVLGEIQNEIYEVFVLIWKTIKSMKFFAKKRI